MINTIAATGHRPNKLGNEYDGIGPYSSLIIKEFEKIFKDHKYSYAISGMALGVDMLFAETALKNDILLIAAIPCIEQEKIWPQKSKDRYYKILDNKLTQKYVVSDKKYDSSVMQIRNRWMVDNASTIVAIWNGSKGGTANCVKYAETSLKHIIYINPEKLINNE